MITTQARLLPLKKHLQIFANLSVGMRADNVVTLLKNVITGTVGFNFGHYGLRFGSYSNVVNNHKVLTSNQIFSFKYIEHKNKGTFLDNLEANTKKLEKLHPSI